MIMPNELTHLVDDVVNRVKRRCSIRLGFEPLPETFDRVLFWGIGGQVFELHPGLLRETPLHGPALVHRGIIQDQDEPRLGKALVQLMQKLQKELGRAASRTLPIKVLGT